MTPERIKELHELLGHVRNLNRLVNADNLGCRAYQRELGYVLDGLPDLEAGLVQWLNREFLQDRPSR